MFKKIISTVILSMVLVCGCFAQNSMYSGNSNGSTYLSSNVNSSDDYYYIVAIQIAQTHFSLDLEDILKDEINKITIEVPVDKSYYDSVYIGEKINDDFRIGSFIMNGSIGNWSVKIIDKRIEKK